MDSFLKYRNCPNCGGDDFAVLFDSNMKQGDFQESEETVYMLPGDKYGRHVRCQNCQLVYVNPIEKESKINKGYSKRKSIDVAIIQKSRLHSSKSQLELVKRHKRGTNLLDIGCGEGFFLFNASKAGYNTKGVELSQDAAAYAEREFGLDVEAGAFEELRFPENYFDVVTLWQVLEHVPYPLTVLKQAHKVLKPEGLLVASTPNIGGIPARILGRSWWNIRRLHINQFTIKTLTDMLKNAGFRNTSPVSYREFISLLMLFIPLLKHLKLYKPLKVLFYPSSIIGRVMDKMVLIYPSGLDNCTVIGFK